MLRGNALYVLRTMKMTPRPFFSLMRALLLAFLVMAGPMISVSQAGLVEPASTASNVGYADYPPCDASELHSASNVGCNSGGSCQVQALSDTFFPGKFTSSASLTALREFSSRSRTISPNPQPPKLVSRF